MPIGAYPSDGADKGKNMKTITQQIFSTHTADGTAETDSIVFAHVDRVMTMDHISSMADEFDALGRALIDPDRFIVVPDHHVPANTAAAATNAAKGRKFCKENHIKHYYEIGRGGICHLLVPEKGLIRPGEIAIGTDSHTCTYGAFGAFATGVGMQDVAVAMTTGDLWFRIPRAYKVVLTGKKKPHVYGKDVILQLIRTLGVDGALYKALEFTGPGLKELTMAERISICNMAVEMGAKNAIFETDDVLQDYFVKTHGIALSKEQLFFTADDAAYERVISLDLSELVPLVALPPLPSNAVPVADAGAVRIDQAFIGSCSNGSFEDMQIAAAVLCGKKIHSDVRLIVLPGTQQIFSRMAQAGLVNMLIDAGAIVGPPTCGPCSGTHMGMLGEGEVCIATTNRNFVARMGSATSKVYLANPAVVAASALAGQISAPPDSL